MIAKINGKMLNIGEGTSSRTTNNCSKTDVMSCTNIALQADSNSNKIFRL